MLSKRECCHKLLLMLLKSVEGKLKQIQNGGCFDNCPSRLFNGKPILRFGAASLSYLLYICGTKFSALLFALFPA